jgi:hypothetical protein
MSRLRIQQGSFPVGGFKHRILNGTPIVDHVPTTTPNKLFENSCLDDLGRAIDHPLTIVHMDRTGLLPLHGLWVSSPSPLSSQEYNQYFPDEFVLGSPAHLNTSKPLDATLATTVLARSNPSRATMSLYNFIYELKDLPGMLRQIGDYRLKRLKDSRRPISGSKDKLFGPKKLSGLSLSYLMGWAPLISDIRKMLNAQQSIDRRIEELNRLFVGGGMKSTVGNPSRKRDDLNNNDRSRFALWENNVTTTETPFIETSLGWLIRCKKTTETHQRSWGTVHWTPTKVPSDRYTDLEMAKLARSLVFGDNLQPQYLWDAIPWSWLVDWFTNAGDFFQANSNVIPCRAGVVNIMTRTNTTISYSRIDNEQLKFAGGSGTVKLETLSRVQSSPLLTAGIPFLNTRQLSTLSALAVNRVL